MRGATRRLLRDGRLHLQHGPIDLIVEAWGQPPNVTAAYDQAEAAFAPVLSDLVGELPSLRAQIGTTKASVKGVVARRMVEAVWPHRATFITPMAAVAGAVADHVLQALCQGRRLSKAYVNNGGDIAFRLAHGRTISLGLAEPFNGLLGHVEIHSSMPVAGMATSGWRGRSFSLGIADAVTVLADDAATADAAATLIANAVSIDHPAIERLPACELDPDSDLEDRLVTVQVGDLDPTSIKRALANGQAVAAALIMDGVIQAAGLMLRGQFVEVGGFQALIAGASDVARSRTARSFG